jgi:hypothetical protein
MATKTTCVEPLLCFHTQVLSFNPTQLSAFDKRQTQDRSEDHANISGCTAIVIAAITLVLRELHA